MVSPSYYKPIIGHFPSISSLWGCTKRSENDITRRAPQGARGSWNLNVIKAEKTASIAGPTRQRPGGVTGRKRPVKAAGNWHVGPSTGRSEPPRAPPGLHYDRSAINSE